MTPTTAPLIDEFIYTPVVNYAIQQNRIPIVRKLVLENTTEEDLHDLKITLTSEPEFVSNWEYRLEILPPNQKIEIEVKDLKLAAKFLSELTERLAGELNLKVFSNNELLSQQSYSVDVLAYDQWNGIGTLPEILAAFVTPNHPEIAKVLQTAATILEGWTGNPSFDGYQSLSPDRVKKQMGAIFEALASLQLVYCAPPASFENTGQRLRTCDTIFAHKLSTCIDTALLYASCIEAIGLNPLLIVLKGHAFVGAWLIDDSFADTVNDDVSLLKKRTATGINEIALVEATSMNAGKTTSFDQAIAAANFHLVKEEDFILFIDVKRARFSGIRPLPQRVKTDSGWEIIKEETPTPRESLTPEDLHHQPETEPAEPTRFSKQKLWERKLLDLSLRNNLLNLRTTRNTIQLLAINLNHFEDALADGNEFQILTRPDDWTNPNQNAGIYQTIGMTDPVVELLNHDLTHKKLRTYLSDTELQSALTKLYRSSRLSLEENGANTLYLALGFLKWYESPKSEQARYAPLLLLPIEIIRRSAQKGYVIRSREEETLMNITLLEMLKQDFDISIGGLAELPRDESGVDVTKIFNLVRRGIMAQSRWDVEEHAFLGIFSFSKFIMWNDIHNNADRLSENKIVKSLASGKLEWETDGLPTTSDLDGSYLPSEIALPISADATQLDAICAAAQNKSFILHGPPGTGKSQTITNIIANALYQGKKVLFVAEKMAALTVVQKRLADVGLGPFCLELHSNKTKKSTVLDQLRQTTEIIRKTSPLEFESEAERLHQLRSELNEYVNALHKERACGFSLYDAFTEYAALEHATDQIPLNKELIEQLSKDQYIAYTDKVEELQNAGSLCTHPHQHPLAQISLSSYNQSAKTQAQEAIAQYLQVLSRKIETTKELCGLLLLNDTPLNKAKTKHLASLSQHLVSLPDSPPTLLNIDHPERQLAQILELTDHGQKRDSHRDTLLNAFTKNVLEINAEALLHQWQQAAAKWLLPRLLGQNKIAKTLRPYSKTGTIDKNTIQSQLQSLIACQKEQEYIDQNESKYANALNFLWNNGNGDWQNIAQICETSLIVNNLLHQITNDPGQTKKTRKKIAELLSEGSSTFINYQGKAFTNYNELTLQQENLEKELSSLLHIDFNQEAPQTTDHTAFWQQNAENWLQNLDLLRDWSSWNRIKDETTKMGLQAVVNSYTQGFFKSGEVLTSFKKSLFKILAEHIIEQEPGLAIFNGKLFEGKIKKFKEQSKYFEALTKAELFAKLASQLPSFTQEAATSSEIGILQRAIRNNGRGLAIRKLFDLIPNLLPRMCPCMLMSPISVAQYFEVDKTKFDLVIFDEASQMPTCDAVGAIARGQNMIVVGDPKQMPPTNFFSSNYFDEENADKEDLESILDDCLALSIPSKHLLWHYRSKHESLIAFSNSNYYENKLLTFPSPDHRATKVTNVYVPGYYDRGKTRQNHFEAKAVVAEVIKRLSNPELAQKSIGIVTFSSVQQNIIEDLLNDQFKKNPDLEKIATEAQEPIFVKNLENVQGDERDIILFSVGYGPDQEGKIYLNFGPLNREGGWRRLNVAISRARYEMKVFSTLRSDDIDSSRTSSEGVAGIKAFLQYSEKGISSLPQKQNILTGPQKTFEKMVAQALQDRGYTVETNIGSSGYKIDIAIVNPDNPSEYLLGILTDGLTYRAAKTAKDRELNQAGVLKMLGWNIYKLWSLDWWDNPEKVLTDIEKAIAQTPDSEPETALDSQTADAQAPDSHAQKREEYADIKLQSLPQPTSRQITQQILEPDTSAQSYQVCELETTDLFSSEDFFDYGRKAKLKEQITEVLQAEAPISHNLLSKRILNAWGISKLGKRLNSYLTDLYLDMELKCTHQNDTIFYWSSDQDPQKHNSFRTPPNDDLKRNAEDIAKEEIACAITDILSNQISLPEADLIREAAKAFGYARLGGNVEQSMRTGIDHALSTDQITKINDRLMLP